MFRFRNCTEIDSELFYMMSIQNCSFDFFIEMISKGYKLGCSKDYRLFKDNTNALGKSDSK